MIRDQKRHWFDISWFYAAWLQFLLRYRKTFLGPVWLLVGPLLFIVVLGSLFSEISSTPSSVFVPYLSIGLISWTLLNGFVIGSTTVFQRGRAQILQGNLSPRDIVIIDIFTNILTFSHQLIIILAVFLYFRIGVSFYGFISLIGLIFLIANGVWLTHFFGIIGARYRDLSEVVQAVMRIAFLATPIIWMPGENGRGGILGVFLTFNPFFHFLELVRAPLLGNTISPLSWFVVIAITFLGFGLAFWFRRRFYHLIPLWI